MESNSEKKENKSLERYSLKEKNIIESYIDNKFGKFSYVNHELVSPDVHLDIYIIEPTKERDFYTLITVGMGAHKMNVPCIPKRKKLKRAELIMTLPKSWKFDTEEGKWTWPIRVLKELGRLPIYSNTWLGFSHTISNQVQYDKSTKLNGAFLSYPFIKKGEIANFTCKIGLFKYINFYQIIPIYEEEMNYKIENGVAKFLDLFPKDFDAVIDIKRKNFLEK